MSEDYDFLIVEEDLDSNLTPPQLKSRRQRKSTAGDRKIQHAWTDDEISRLIASVEQHRGIWDFSCPEYKLTKLDGWRSVVDDLDIEGVDVNEAKVKWSSLRTTYMVNLAKLRKKKSGQGAGESHNVTWKFFKSMMFLENNNLQHSTSSTSTLQLESDCMDVEEFPMPSPPSKSELAICNKRKRSTPITTPSSTSGDSSKSQAISILNTAVAALHSSDANSTFCDNLLAELRTLSESRAQSLRFKLSRVMMDFIEATHEPKPVQFGNKSVHEVPVKSLSTSLIEQTIQEPTPLRSLEEGVIDSNDDDFYCIDPLLEIVEITEEK